jgi:hypothetical protein
MKRKYFPVEKTPPMQLQGKLKITMDGGIFSRKIFLHIFSLSIFFSPFFKHQIKCNACLNVFKLETVKIKLIIHSVFMLCRDLNVKKGGK